MMDPTHFSYWSKDGGVAFSPVGGNSEDGWYQWRGSVTVQPEHVTLSTSKGVALDLQTM